MIGTRAVGGRLVSVVGVALLSALAAAACATGGSPTLAAPATSAVVTPAGVDPARTVPAPVDGALRTRLPATGSTTGPSGGVLLFGDSVAVLFADELAVELPGELHVDGLDCRRLDLGFTGPCGGVPAGRTVATGMEDLRDLVAELEAAGIGLDAAVLVIANNAALDADGLDAAMDVLAPVPRVWWVTTDVEGRGWRDPNNALLAALAARDERAGVIDWFAAGAGRDWRSDHVHPDDAGQAALAALVADHLRCDCVP